MVSAVPARRQAAGKRSADYAPPFAIPVGIGLVGKPAVDYLVKAAPCSASVGAAAALAVYIGHVKVYQRMRCSMGSGGVSSRRFLELSTRRLSCATRGA
jgi:hypothetical protein